jgi:hypothetical protein
MSPWLIRGRPRGFERMDGAQLASICRGRAQGRGFGEFSRPTKVFEDGIQKSNNKHLLNVDGIIASRGGVPRIDDAKSVGRARPGRRTRRPAWPAQRRSTSEDLNRPLKCPTYAKRVPKRRRYWKKLENPFEGDRERHTGGKVATASIHRRGRRPELLEPGLEPARGGRVAQHGDLILIFALAAHRQVARSGA